MERGERGDRDRFGGRRNNGGFEDRGRRDEPVLEEQRPKLKLAPRTLPLPEGDIKPDNEDEKQEEPLADEEPAPPRPKPVPAASIFGAAKPVDTAAKDREIEERLERERVEKKALEEKEKAEKAEKAEKEEKAALEEGKKEKSEDGDGEGEEQGEGEGEKEGEGEIEGEGAKEKTDAADPTSAAPAPSAAVPIPSEPISWRRKNDDESAEPSKTQSPPRRRFSPNRRPRRNGK